MKCPVDAGNVPPDFHALAAQVRFVQCMVPLYPRLLNSMSSFLPSAAKVACPANSHSAAGSATCSCNDGYIPSTLLASADLVCLTCPPNAFCVDNTVTNCTANSYALAGRLSLCH
jgi:hypothetical protein